MPQPEHRWLVNAGSTAMTSSTGACCRVGEEAQERAPPGILDALGEMVVLEQIADLQLRMRDRVIGLDQRERRLVVNILPLTLEA
jgi:hypothetical protein